MSVRTAVTGVPFRLGRKRAAPALTADAAGDLSPNDEERVAEVRQTMAMGAYLAELMGAPQPGRR